MNVTSNEEEGTVDLREFVLTRLPLIREDYFMRGKSVNEAIKSDMQLPEVAMERLIDMCNPMLLNQIEDQRSINSLDDLNSEYLSVLDYVKSNFDKSNKRNHPYEIKFLKNLAKLNELDATDPNDQVQTPGTILNVQISQALNSRLSKLAWSEDYLVLGENTLAELKDKISCFREEIRIGEFSEDPEKIVEAPAIKDLIKSGYFLIENVLYEDTRWGQTDCGAPVLKWAHEKSMGEFRTLPMQETHFSDLKVRLGFPYLYKHVGNCEHLVLFTSVRLLNPSSDCYVLSKYPIPKDRTRGRFTFCWCCNRLYAKWVVCASKYSVDDPTFLCQRCFLNTHYVQDDTNTTDSTNNEPATDLESFERNHPRLKKICDFKAYHFSQL